MISPERTEGIQRGYRAVVLPSTSNERSTSVTQGFGPVTSPARDLRVKSCAIPAPIDMAEDKAFTDAVYTVQDIAVGRVPCGSVGAFLPVLT